MAWKFADEIHALSGFDAESGDNTETDEDFNVHATQWLKEGLIAVINQFPNDLKIQCATRSTLNNSATTLDLDGKGQVLHVTRVSADSGGFEKVCRKIPGMYGDISNDSSDLMYFATVTDPVYWETSNSSGNPTLFVKPLPTANQPSYVHHVAYPTITQDSTSITNFPDEFEYLVVLHAAIKATEYMMLTEEDQEVYAPQLQTLKQDYQQGLQSLSGGEGGPRTGGGG